jgi:hypothetical protein
MQEDQLSRAVAAGIITPVQAKQLSAFLAQAPRPQVAQGAEPSAPRFDLAHVLWYLGALIIMGAMGLFSTLAFSLMGSPALLATSVAYAIAFTAAGHHLWHKRGLTTPGGLLIAVAVSMTPLAIYSLQDMAGWWAGMDRPGTYQGFFKWIKGGFLPMEIATVAASLVALRFYRFPFILFIASVALWFMSMDLADWLKGVAAWSSEGLRKNVSMVFGLILIAIAWAVDLRRTDKDMGFWLHLVGIATFWGGLSLQNSDSELSKFLYCLLNLGLIGLAVFLSRRVYAVFGGIGVIFYLGYLAYQVFKDSLLFPFAMSAVGLAVIGLGLLYYRKAGALNAALEGSLPAGILRLRPAVHA